MRWTCQGGRTTGPNVLDEGSSVVRRQSFPRHPKVRYDRSPTLAGLGREPVRGRTLTDARGAREKQVVESAPGSRLLSHPLIQIVRSFAFSREESRLSFKNA